jgi:uncharacterized FlaG/YvyC family protein
MKNSAVRQGENGKVNSGQETFALKKKLVRTSSDVSLRFEVDSQNHELTIYILDKANKKVLRTIPPDELKDLLI